MGITWESLRNYIGGRIMDIENKREEIVQHIANMLRNSAFTFEYRVVKKPKGMKVIHEVTQEQLNLIIEKSKNHGKEEETV